MITYTFILTSLIVVIVPGTGVIYTLSIGLSKGRASSFFAAIGCTLGIIPHLVISILVILIFEDINNTLLNIIKILGALYLLYLGIRLLKSSEYNISEQTNDRLSYLKIIIRAISINLLNPKLTIFFIAFLPQFIIASNLNIIYQCLVLGIIFMFITLVVFLFYGVLASTFTKFLQNNSKIRGLIQKIFGIIFIILAVQLAISHI